MHLVAEKGVFLILVSPTGHHGQSSFAGSGTSLAGVGFLAEAVGISPQMSGINGGIALSEDS